MDLMQYVDEQITKIRKIHSDYLEAIEKVKKQYSNEWITMYSTPVKISPEAVAANEIVGREVIGKLMEEKTKEIEEIIQETEKKIASEKKKAIQECVALEPVPTDEHLRRVEQLKVEYDADGIFKMMKFRDDMLFHVENETVYDFPYYLLARKMFADTAEEQQTLIDVYNKLFPQIAEKQALVKNAEDALKMFKTQKILFRFSTCDGNMSTLESIGLKRQLYEMGTINQLVQ